MDALSLFPLPLLLGLRMEAIKKKMQAMKVEKDNLCDRCDEVEQVEPAFSRHVVVDYFLKLLT